MHPPVVSSGWESKPNIGVRMCAMTKMCATWLRRPSHALVASMWPSTMWALKGKPGPVTEQSAESYAATFDTNVLGTLLSMKHELRVMLPQGNGSIVNVSSTYGHLGAAGASLYAASKHAVEGLTRSAALEAAEFGVRVNVVAPGPIDTAMLTRFSGTAARKSGLVAGVPLQRMGKPEEIAQLIVFLASDKASFSTGATFAADGGKTAR